MFNVYVPRVFTDVYPDADRFVEALKTTGLIKISDDSLTTLYGLIYSEYGDRDVLAETDYKFNMQIASKIFKYGQAWEARIRQQDAIVHLNEDDIRNGTRVVSNSASTAGSRPQVYEEILDKINAQNVNYYKKSKVEALNELKDSIESDVTTQFIAKFEDLFSVWPTGEPDDKFWIPEEWFDD